MSKHFVGKSSIIHIPNIRGLLRITHIPTGKFFLVTTKDLGTAANTAYRQIQTGHYYNHKLVELTNDVDTELRFTIEVFDSDETARNRKHRVMAHYYQNPLLLNEQDWPKLIGAFKLTHRATGKYYAGKTNDLAKQHSFQMALLRTGKHKSPELQELWNSDPKPESFSWEWHICEDISQAKVWSDNLKNAAADLCLNSKRFLSGAPDMGFYLISFNCSEHYYIGSAAKLRDRIAHHRWSLKMGRHTNPRLQEYYNTHGEDFEVKFQFTKTREEAYALEQKWLDRTARDPYCLNLANDAKSSVNSINMSIDAKERKQRGIKKWHDDNPEHMKRIQANAVKARSKGISVDGTTYSSLRKAWEATGKNWDKLYKRLNDPTDLQCFRLAQPKQDS